MTFCCEFCPLAPAARRGGAGPPVVGMQGFRRVPIFALCRCWYIRTIGFLYIVSKILYQCFRCFCVCLCAYIGTVGRFVLSVRIRETGRSE